jgi:sugar O-acyltransferase (sialic acid O-acetyltransferase NeuD family)
MEIIVIGAGGHAKSTADAIRQSGHQIRYFVGEAPVAAQDLMSPLIASVKDIPDTENLNVVVAIGDSVIRERIFQGLQSSGYKISYPNIFHPKAFVSTDSVIGHGNVVLGFANIGAGSKIGNFVIINTSASVDHDSDIADFVTISPGAICAGNVAIGEHSFIGMGALVSEGRRIGDKCVLGANSFLNVDLPKGSKAFGSPARIVNG